MSIQTELFVAIGDWPLPRMKMDYAWPYSACAASRQSWGNWFKKAITQLSMASLAFLIAAYGLDSSPEYSFQSSTHGEAAFMTTMLSEVYQALRNAGVPEDDARAAAEALAAENLATKDDVRRLERELLIIT